MEMTAVAMPTSKDLIQVPQNSTTLMIGYGAQKSSYELTRNRDPDYNRIVWELS